MLALWLGCNGHVLNVRRAMSNFETTEHPPANLSSYVRLPDAYNYVAVSLIPDWPPYDIIINDNDHFQKTNVSKHVRATKTLGGLNTPEIELLTLEKIKALSSEMATTKQVDAHHRVLQYLFKPMSVGDIKHVAKHDSGVCHKLPYRVWFCKNDEFVVDVLLSEVFRAEGGEVQERWSILVDPESLMKAMEPYRRSVASRKNPKGGRKPTIPWHLYNDKIIALYTSGLNIAQCTRELRTWISAEKSRFCGAGQKIEDITPSESAVRKYICQFKKSGEITQG